MYSGYMGAMCDDKIDHCKLKSCFPGVPCANDKNKNMRTCGSCPEGFTGNGITCDPIECSPPPSQYKGRPRTAITSAVLDGQAFYACGFGYEKDATLALTCKSNRSWVASVDKCTKILCPALNFTSDLGEVVMTDGILGPQSVYSKAKYECNETAYISGGPTSFNTYVRTCQENGTYSGEEPACELLPTKKTVLDDKGGEGEGDEQPGKKDQETKDDSTGNSKTKQQSSSIGVIGGVAGGVLVGAMAIAVLVFLRKKQEQSQSSNYASNSSTGLNGKAKGKKGKQAKTKLKEMESVEVIEEWNDELILQDALANSDDIYDFCEAKSKETGFGETSQDLYMSLPRDAPIDEDVYAVLPDATLSLAPTSQARKNLPLPHTLEMSKGRAQTSLPQPPSSPKARAAATIPCTDDEDLYADANLAVAIKRPATYKNVSATDLKIGTGSAQPSAEEPLYFDAEELQKAMKAGKAAPPGEPAAKSNTPAVAVDLYKGLDSIQAAAADHDTKNGKPSAAVEEDTYEHALQNVVAPTAQEDLYGNEDKKPFAAVEEDIYEDALQNVVAPTAGEDLYGNEGGKPPVEEDLYADAGCAIDQAGHAELYGN